MKTKPWLIKSISISLFFVPLALLAIIYASKSMGRHAALSSTAIELICLFGIASVLVGYNVWRVRPLGYTLLFIFGVGVMGADTVQLITRPKNLNALYFVDFILVGCTFFIMSRKRIREAYFNPKIRWWETPKRHHADFDGVFDVNGKQITAPILDISVGGCFVDLPIDGAGEYQSRGDKNLKIDICHGGIQMACEGRIVRTSENPHGVGIMFLNSSKAHRRQVKEIIRSLQ